jgi:hypothetical protein
MRKNLVRLVLSSLLPLAVAGAAGPALAKPVFLYPTECKVKADGLIKASAFIATPSLVDTDFRTASLVASHAISGNQSFTVDGIGSTYAEVFRSGYGDDGCTADISSAVAGQTSYSINAQLQSLSTAINTLSIHSVMIDRQNVTGTGNPITAANEYTVPQANQLNVYVPFFSGGGTVTVAQLDFFRQDSTSTTGSMVGAFQIFEDTNGNCQLDAGEQAVEGGKGRVGPDDTYSEPAYDFQLASGDFILVLSYFTDIDLAGFSPTCAQDVNLSGNVADGFNLTLTIDE